MAAASETMKELAFLDNIFAISEADKAKALSEMAEVISSKEEGEAAKTLQIDRFVTLYYKYQHYKLNFDQPIGKKTLMDLAFKAENIDVCIKLSAWGATLPKKIMDAIVEKRPAFLEEMRVEKENRKKQMDDFDNALGALLHQVTADFDKKKEERDQQDLKILADFQVKCQAVLQQVEPHCARMDAIVAKCNQQIPDGQIKGRELKKEILTILSTINDHSITLTRVTLKMIWNNGEALPPIQFIVFYSNIAKKFDDKKKEIDDMIKNSLPPLIRADIEKLVADDRVIFNKVLKDLMLALLASNKGMLGAFRAKIPVDLYESIWNQYDEFTHVKLVPINRQFLFEIRQFIGSFREKLGNKYQNLFGLIPNPAVVQGMIQAEAMQFDCSAKMFLQSLTQIPENSFNRFVQTYEMRVVIEYLATQLQLIPDCMVAVLRSNQYSKPEDRQAVLVAYNDKQNQSENEPEIVSQADVKRRDDKTLKALEQARRAAVKEQEGEQQRELLLLKEIHAKMQKDKIVKDQVKTKLLQRFQKLKDGAEKNLLIKIFSPGDLHRVITESDFVKLVSALGLDPRPNGAGGHIFNIQTIPKPINFHHWEGDMAGTLDGNVLREFREALTAVGISREDLVKSEVPKTAATATAAAK